MNAGVRSSGRVDHGLRRTAVAAVLFAFPVTCVLLLVFDRSIPYVATLGCRWLTQQPGQHHTRGTKVNREQAKTRRANCATRCANEAPHQHNFCITCVGEDGQPGRTTRTGVTRVSVVAEGGLGCVDVTQHSKVSRRRIFRQVFSSHFLKQKAQQGFQARKYHPVMQ